MKIFFYKRLMTCTPRFLHNFFQPLTSWRLSEAVSVSLAWTCRLYHENLLLQKFDDMYAQVLTQFFSASNIMEAVRGRFLFYGTKLSTLSWKSSFTKGWRHVYPGSYTIFFSLWHHGGCQRPFPFLWYEPVDFIMKIFF